MENPNPSVAPREEKKAVAPNLLARITRAVRAADQLFQSSGGSSRHWVDECLLPALAVEHLAVVEDFIPHHAESAGRNVNSLALKLDAAEAEAAEFRRLLSKTSLAIDASLASGKPIDGKRLVSLGTEIDAALVKAGGK